MMLSSGGGRLLNPANFQRHVPCFSMLVNLNFLLMHAEYLVFPNDVCHDLHVLHANILCVIETWLLQG